MAPTPQENIPQAEMPSQRDGDRIVISGMSGLYPNCHNVKDFSDLLYDKVNPVISGKPRWKYSHPEVQTYIGTVPGLDRFDAQFFGIHYRLASTMDTMARKVLEQAYNAIYDAGLAPEHIFGKKVGVYIGGSFMESEKACFYDAESRSGFSIVGCCKTMFANRISYWLNAKGPSMAVDTVCCSSTVALEQAYRAMKRGECDVAIVGGSTACLHPQTSVHFSRLIKACSDGKTKSFDENADGCAKSEAISIMVLQKMKDARRIYAEVLHVKSQFKSPNNEQGLKFEFNRDPEDVTKFLQEFYEETNVNPQAVEYVEAVGCAVPEVDKMELEVFEKIFCKDRIEPLLVGSVTSNIGYVEAASGLSAITKVLIGYEKGELSANLHCTNPRRDVDALREGRMRIVTEHQPIRRSYIAVNGMSISGVNTHVLLHGYYKPKDPTHYKTSIPRLVTISGRQESSVKKIFDDLKKRPIDPEELALLHNIHEMKIFGHMSWGFTILDTNENGETVSLAEKIDYFDDVKRPLWFVYSGMGSQWAGMGTQLMRIPIFSAAIKRCHNVLAPKGLDIVHIITTTDKTIFDNILHSFVGIAAVQIGLTDILREIGLVPDNIIGHSVGELGCAYADGCFTAEEMILSAYARGLVSVQTPLVRGSMAAVGVGYKQVKNLCPPEIEVACHNGPDSSTISGPADVMKEFVAKLTAQGIFAKEVPCSNIAYHSRYIADAGPQLMQYLQEVIKTPKKRSERWLSTSVPQERWTEENVQYSSAWYHTNNLLNSVLFEETSRLVPSNAVLVEIAPHGLLQAILKRSLPADCRNVPLTKRGHPDNVTFLLEGIGKLYMEGHISKVANLYPKVEFPVSTGTPMLSHLVEWNHTEKWKLPLYLSAARKTSSILNMVISVYDDENAFLQGHVLREKTVYPFAAVLVAVWDTLAISSGTAKRQLPVEFRDVHLFAQPAMPAERQLRVRVALHKGTGRFEVLNEQSLVASGFINELSKDLPKSNPIEFSEKLELDSESVYIMLKERDHFYSGDFRSIHKTNTSFTEAELLWNNNWVAFIDGMLQLNILKHSHSTVSQPSHINKICIDVKSHPEHQVKIGEKTIVRVSISENKTRCGGILLDNIQLYDLPPMTPVTLALKTLKFDPHTQSLIKMHTEENLMASKENASKERSVMLQCGRIGDLDTLHWVESPALVEDGIKVTVHYTALNDLDVKRATGVVSFKQDSAFDDNTYGMDFSGFTDSGVRVMGMASGGAAVSHLQAQRELLWPVPAHWSLEDAATVPSAYAQAFYCLGIKSKLSPGMTVLVHGGAGALGQAAISIALAHQCRVFTTVGTLHKKRFLTKLFPDLNEDDIGNSRDHTFSDMVLRATNSRGCDIIISCVRGNIKNATLKCGAYCGITFDTVQAYTEDNYAYGMHYMTKQRTYSLVNFTSIFKYKERMIALRAMVSEGIARGYVRPLSRVVYAAQDAPRAFRLLAASRHRGRVLLRLKDSELSAEPRILYSEESSHVIICDNEGLGVQLANRLVSRGVKKLRLHCAKVPTHLHLKVKTWENLGVQTEVSSEDLSTSRGVQVLLNNELGPIEGIYLIMIADNNKVHVSNIDLGSRKLCPYLKYFAVLSADSRFGQEIYLDRTQNKLPMTLLYLPALKKGAIVWRSALDAIESALRSNQQLLIAEEPDNKHQQLFQKISAIAGIGIQDNLEETTTLNELGLDSSKLQAISAFLLNTYNVYYREEQIMELTVKEIHELEESQKDLVFKEAKGLEMFFSNVEPDELLATAELVFLSTLVRNVSTRDDDIDANMTYLCIVPGLEGLHNRFTTMCSRLKVPAMGLQPGLDNLHESLPDTARRYTEILLKKSTIGNNFYLMGYEIGILMALQVAANLEEKGYTGTVFCVGGAPEEVLEEFNEQLREMDTEEALRDAVVKHMATVMLEGFDEDWEKASTWQSKLDACVTSLLSREPHSLQYAQTIVEAAYARIEQIRNYKLQPKRLHSQIIILRPASSPRSVPDVLQQHSHQPILEYDLQASLAHAAMDPRCASIINRHLSTDILESYESRNLCETYLLNADTFITKATVEDD